MMLAAFRSLSLGGSSSSVPAAAQKMLLLPTSASLHTTTPAQSGGPFQKSSGTVLWKTNTSVSAQGKQRGRARGLIKFKDLNRGQKVGMGEAQILWPGLNAHAINRDGEKTRIGQMKEQEYGEYIERMTEVRDRKGFGRIKRKVNPLDRGWTGSKPGGRKYQMPLAKTEAVSYDGFETVLLESKIVSRMTGRFGRLRQKSLLMITGNKAGLAGFSITKGPAGRSTGALDQRACNRAGVKLLKFNLYEDRTVYHDFFTQFGTTRLFVKQRPPGYGVKAHRSIKAICEMIGIKDVEAIIDGRNKNYLHITKAFVLGLLRQRTHQELADEKRLHLVELRGENDFYPRLVASPREAPVRTEQEIPHDEILDFKTICYDGQLPLIKHTAERTLPTPESNNPVDYARYFNKRKTTLHHRQQRIQMLSDFGEVRSHLTEHFPECKPADYKKPRKGVEDED